MNHEDRTDLSELKHYLTKELHEINVKIDRIERGMYGDIDNHQTGIVESFRTLSQRVKRLESFRDRIAIIIAFSSGVIGLASSWLWKLIFNND